MKASGIFKVFEKFQRISRVFREHKGILRAFFGTQERGFPEAFDVVLGVSDGFKRSQGASESVWGHYRDVPWDLRGYKRRFRNVLGMYHWVSDGFNRFMEV